MDGHERFRLVEENGQRQERGVGWETVAVEKRISPVRRSQKT